MGKDTEYKIAIELIKGDLKDLRKMHAKAIKTGLPQFGLNASDIEARIKETEALIK